MGATKSEFKRKKVRKKTYRTLTVILTITTVIWSIGAYVGFLLPDKPAAAGDYNPIVISEIKPDGDDTFVELYVRSPNTFSIDENWYLQYCTSDCDNNANWTTNQVQLATSSTDLTGGSFFLVGVDGMSPTPDKTLPAGFASAISANSGSIRLFVNMGDGFVPDKVGWGTTLEEDQYEGSAMTVITETQSIERKAFCESSDETTMNSASSGAHSDMGNDCDSDDNGWDLFTKGTPEPQNSSSPVEVFDGFDEGQEGNMPPFIYYTNPIGQAPAGQDLRIYAGIFDDSNIATNAATKTALYYRDGTSGDFTAVAGTQACTGCEWAYFDIPSAALTADHTIQYYLKATDGTSLAEGDGYQTTEPGGGADAPYSLTVVSSVSHGYNLCDGTIKDSLGNNVANAIVYLSGTGYYDTTNASGKFSFGTGCSKSPTFSSIPNPPGWNGTYEVIAFAQSYIDNRSEETSNASNVTITLSNDFGGGGSGDREGAFLMWSAPMEGMMGAPRNIGQSPVENEPPAPIILCFSEAMKTTTINTDNVKLYKMSSGSAAEVSNMALQATDSGTCPTNQGWYFYNSTATLLDANTPYIVTISSNVQDASGNAIQGNRPGGSIEFSFNTMGDMFIGGENQHYGQGAFQPPFITGTNPAPGAMNVSLNTSIVVNFASALMNSSENLANIVLLDPNGSSVSISRTLDQSTMDRVILDPTSNLSASSNYSIVVKGALQGNSGIYLGDPGSQQNTSDFIFYQSMFDTGTGTDSSGPTVSGTYPANGDTGITPDISDIQITFSEAVDPSTINTNTVQIKQGSNVVQGDLTYSPVDRTAHFMPMSALNANTTYTITVTTEVTDLASNTATAHNGTFNTSTADSTQPTIVFARADDYSMAITFDRPMTHVSGTNTSTWSDGVTTLWSTSILNPAKYKIWQDGSPSSPYGATEGGAQTLDNFSGLSFTYDAQTTTVLIEGLQLLADPPADFHVNITGVRGTNGATLGGAGGQTMQGYTEMSSNTGGMMGPMSGGGMMGPMSSGGPGDFGMHGAGDMMFNPVGVWPMNSMASKTSRYMVDLPITTAIEANGQILLTFPTGFNISSAALVPTSQSPANSDFNGPATGTVVASTTASGDDSGDTTTKGGIANDGITINSSARIITLTLGAVAANANDFLHFELQGIVNSSIAKGFDTSGYTVDIKTKNSSGVILESQTSMPFFISEPGENTINVTINADGYTGTQSVNLYAGSPMTGPMDTTAEFNGSGVATASFTSLPNGDYHFFLDPTVTLNSTEWSTGFPEPTWVTGGETKAVTINLTDLSDSSNAAPLTVKIVNSSGTNANVFSNENIDIFGSGPGGFTTKTITGVTNTDADGYTVYLTNTGFWDIGIGPSMPKGPMAGPPPMPDWMPPPPVHINVTSISPASFSVTHEPNNTSWNSNTNTLTLTIPTANKQITGKVVDAASTGIANMEVFAYQPMGFGGMGSHTTTNSSGVFTLKVAEYGTYKIGAFKPGLGDSPEKTVEVRDSGGSAVVYYDGQLSTGSTGDNPLYLKMYKPDYTISGKVMDSSSNSIPYAPIWASTSDGRFVHGGTDSDGRYTLFVAAGTWTITSEMPMGTDACGSLTKTVTVSTESKANQNIQPSSSTCYTISGSVSIGGSPQTNKSVFIHQWDSDSDQPAGGYNRDAWTDSSGAYSVKAGNGTYRACTWTMDYGELCNTGTVNGDNLTLNITSSSLSTLTINFTGGASDMSGFMETKRTDGPGRRGRPIASGDLAGGSITMSLPAGTYDIFANIKGLGQYSSTSVDLSSDAAVTFDVSGTDRYTISGNVQDSDSNAVANAWVWIGNPLTGFHVGTTTNSSGAYSIKLATGTGYNIGVDMPNYISPAPATLDVSADATYDFTGDNALTRADNVISGTIYESNGSTAATEGFTWCDKSGGGWSGSPINGDGSFSLAVTDGTWTCKAMAPGHAETEFTSAITVSGSSPDPVTVTLTADATKAKKSASSSGTTSSGISMDDTDNTGMKVTLPSNFSSTSCSTAGCAQATLSQSYDKPETSSSSPLGDKSYNVTAAVTGSTSTTNVSQLSADMEIIIEYDPTDLPDGTSEDNLSLSYWDSSVSNWVVLDEYTVDTTNNTITGSIDHLTSFAITHPPVSAATTARQVAESEEEIVTTGPTETTSGEVLITAAEGGTATATTEDGGTLAVTVPSNAMAGQAMLNVVPTAAASSVANTPPTDYQVVGLNYFDISSTRTTDVFDQAVTLTFSYADSLVEGIDENSLVVHWYNEATDAWEALATTVDPANNTVTATTTHLSLFAIMGLAAEEVAEGIQAGDLVVVEGFPTVYQIGEDGKRHAFVDEKSFMSWHTDFSAVKTVDLDTLLQYPLGANMTYKPGSLIKLITVPKVYRVDSPNILRWIINEAVFKGLGYTFALVNDLPDAFFSDYQLGDDITETDLPGAQTAQVLGEEVERPNYTVLYIIAGIILILIIVLIVVIKKGSGKPSSLE